MSYPHVIRLRGPWTFEPLERWTSRSEGEPTDELPPGGKSAWPDWTETLGAGFRGRVRFTRPFNRPTNLGPDERVCLACEGADARGTVWLNGQVVLELEGPQARRCDITGHLQPHNRLVAEIALGDGQPGRPADRAGLGGGLLGEVRLEIGPPLGA